MPRRETVSNSLFLMVFVGSLLPYPVAESVNKGAFPPLQPSSASAIFHPFGYEEKPFPISDLRCESGKILTLGI